MKERGYFTFWPIFTVAMIIVLGTFLIVILFVFFEAFTSPRGISANEIAELGGIALIFIVAFGIVIIIGVINAKESITTTTTLNFAPTLHDVVKIVAKTSSTTGAQNWADTTFTITIEFQKRVRKIMKVNEEQYSYIAEGETGLLTYKQNKDTLYFVSFEPLL